MFDEKGNIASKEKVHFKIDAFDLNDYRLCGNNYVNK